MILQRRLIRTYHRLGPRYLQAAIVEQLQLGDLRIALNSCALALYVDLSTNEVLLLLGTAIGAWRYTTLPTDAWREGAWSRCAAGSTVSAHRP